MPARHCVHKVRFIQEGVRPGPLVWLFSPCELQTFTTFSLCTLIALLPPWCRQPRRWTQKARRSAERQGLPGRWAVVREEVKRHAAATPPPPPQLGSHGDKPRRTALLIPTFPGKYAGSSSRERLQTGYPPALCKAARTATVNAN